jgi:hypothetical protein
MKKHPANIESEMLFGKTQTMGIVHSTKRKKMRNRFIAKPKGEDWIILDTLYNKPVLTLPTRREAREQAKEMSITAAHAIAVSKEARARDDDAKES